MFDRLRMMVGGFAAEGAANYRHSPRRGNPEPRPPRHSRRRGNPEPRLSSDMVGEWKAWPGITPARVRRLNRVGA